MAQGLLTNKYLGGDIPEDSRAATPHGFLRPSHITDEKLAKVRALKVIADERGQTLAQMALAWVLRHSTVTSALIGASRVSQIEDCAGVVDNLELSSEELARIEGILSKQA